MIRYVNEGNIFTIDGIKCYAHGCNCAGAMGKGIALQFKLKYPQMYRLYKKKGMAGTFIVGDVFEYVTGDVTILLVNLTLVSLKKYWLKAESKESFLSGDTFSRKADEQGS